METPILRAERELYEGVWQIPGYDTYSPGEKYAAAFVDMAQTTMTRGSVLDAGCGSGKGALALQALGFNVTMCDVTSDGLVPEARHLPFHDACLWGDLKRVVGFRDWVYCTDVLEHIPTPLTMLVVQRLLDVARRGVFLSIHLHDDHFGVWVGRRLHQTVQSFVEWRDQLSELARVVECRDCLVNGLYLLEPK